MMICPKTFLDEHIVGKTATEIKKEIDKLKKRNRKLKWILENPNAKSERLLRTPHPKVEISMNIEYMDISRLYLIELTGENYITQVDKRVMEFSENIADIKEIELYIGSCFEPYETKVYRFDGDKIIRCVKDWNNEESDAIELESDKESFLEMFDRLNIGSWRRHYDTRRFGYDILDGTQWGITIRYNNHKEQEYGGSNAYPYNFDDLCDLLEVDKKWTRL